MLTREFAAQRRASITLTSQDIEVDLAKAGAANVGDYPVLVRLQLATTSPQLVIDARAATEIAVTVDGVAHPHSYSDDEITLTELPVGRDIVIEIAARMRFSRDGQGLHRYFDPEDGGVYLYTHFEPNDAHRAWPCFDQPDLKTSWRLTVHTPASWQVLGNQPAASGNAEPEAGGGVKTVVFAPTPLLSPYLVALAAGDYVRVGQSAYRCDWDSFTAAIEPVCAPLGAGETREITGRDPIELGVYCRRTLAAYLPAETVIELTTQCLDFYHERYRFPYPWGKYDQVFVPEYNIGAMENPGCITFNERYIVRGTWSSKAREALANVIAHEMCHMWFGDLVTPHWWNDLWLKESFADHESYSACASATEFSHAWATFAGERKAWAYTADLSPTTHPIAADIPDVAAASQNFDGITYAKGAAVVKQLIAWVGPEAFLPAIRAYFRKFAFACAGMDDLIDALGQRADLSNWVKPWIETAGPSIARFHGARLEIESVDPRTGQPVTRPHRLLVGVATDGTANRQVIDTREPAGLDLGTTEAAARALINDQDLTYLISEYDHGDGVNALLRECVTGTDPMAAALAWSALRLDVWRNRLPAAAYLDLFSAEVGRIHPAIAGAVATGAGLYLSDWGGEATPQLVTRLLELYRQALAEDDPDTRLVITRVFGPALVAATGPSPDFADLIATAPVDDRWVFAQAAVAAGLSDPDTAISAVADDSGRGQDLAWSVRSAVSGEQHHWLDRLIDAEWTNAQQAAILSGVALARRTDDHRDWDFDQVVSRLGRIWETKPIHLARHLAKAIIGPDPALHERLEAAQFPPALGRELRERIDYLRRQARARELGAQH